jgi:peroxiredoxin
MDFKTGKPGLRAEHTKATAAIVILALFTAWINWRAKALEIGYRGHHIASQLTGKPAPEFAMESLKGPKISLNDYHGKTLVISFWASWCGPCRMELPLLAEFYRQTHNQESDFEIIAISLDTTRDAAERAAKSLKLPFPVLLDADSRVADAYLVDRIPAMFVIGKSGTITHSETGFRMGFDILLAQQLGLTNYIPVTGGHK